MQANIAFYSINFIYCWLQAKYVAVTILKQLFKELSFQKSWPIKRNDASSAFRGWKQKPTVGHSYKPLLLPNKILQIFW